MQNHSQKLTDHQKSQLELIEWVHKVELKGNIEDGVCPIALRLRNSQDGAVEEGLYLVCNDYCCDKPVTVQQVKAYLDILGITYV